MHPYLRMAMIAQKIAPFAVAMLLAASAAQAEQPSQAAAARLLAAYPTLLERIEDGVLVWRDGTRMALDDGKGRKAFADWLEHPDIEDMLAVPYPAGAPADPPAKDTDPGRARNAAFFDKVYGDCRKGEVEKNLTPVVWLPKKSGRKLPVSKINGAAKALEAVSRELDELPASFDVYLYPSAGTYNCRVIAGTDRVSAHGHGIAIDIALKHSDYWRNATAGKDGVLAYKNKIPMEIVRIFEKHGFIWGGRWYHYDTMHFEYRPELLGGK
jgi:hypothetical protein